MTVSPENRARYRATLISREVKRLFMAIPERFAEAVVRRFLLGMVLRWLFLAEDGTPHRAGEIVLAELRARGGHLRPSLFDPNPQLMAYREGWRAATQWIFNHLNLDEAKVQKLMELDDGLE